MVEWDPFSYAVQDNPYPIYQELVRSRPLYRNDKWKFWAVSRLADVKAIANDTQRFSSASGVNIEDLSNVIGPQILIMDPPRHGQLRSLIQHKFSTKSISALEPEIRAMADELVKEFIERGKADLAREFAQILPVRVILRVLGLPLEDEALIRQWATTMLLRNENDDQVPEASLDAAAQMRSYLLQILKKRRKQPRDDIVSILATGQVSGSPMSEEELLGMCLILYLAGNTTTTSLISNSLLVLARNPDQRSKLIKDLSALPIAVEELLRYESPVQYTSRVTTCEVELHGQLIPRGERVVLLLGAANRDPQEWRDPDTLDLFRPPKPNVAFGHGMHHCIGAQLARLEGKVAFELILSRMPDYAVVGPVERLYFSTERGLASLPVEF